MDARNSRSRTSVVSAILAIIVVVAIGAWIATRQTPAPPAITTPTAVPTQPPLAKTEPISPAVTQPLSTTPSAAVAAPPVVAKKTLTRSVIAVPTPTQLMQELESTWSRGGASYHLAVNRLADEYASKMDKDCNIQTHFDFSAAIAEYEKAIRPSAEGEAQTQHLVNMQVITLACMTMHGDGLARAARVTYARK